MIAKVKINAANAINLTLSYEEFGKMLDNADKKILEVDSTGAWFNGSKEALEEWSGDVLPEYVEHCLNYLGIEVNWTDDNDF